jgi:hypothetical protein
MSKAIQGAVELAGAVGMGIAAFYDPALIASPIFDKIWAGLVIGGLSMEAGAVAGALTSNRGMNITTRQAAACRQIIYGQQRVGGVEIYRSTTGSSHDQFNYIIVLAGHQSDSILNLYLDGRQVHWLGSGPGYSVRNGVGFGGVADNNTYTGPNAVPYNFGGTGHSGIYAEARYGDQVSGDVMGSLTANDPNWAASSAGNPWVGGCTYIYLKIEFNTNLFPGEPEIRLTVNGKDNIWDPRTETTGFTTNWALIAADVIADPIFGLGDNTVNQPQLVAAANVCDESVTLAVTNTPNFESRYTTNYHYDTSVAPIDALNAMMAGAAGRYSRIGGEWYLWPAFWQGPSFTFDEGDLTAPMQWTPNRSRRDLFNRVTGTYTAPTYPYNVAGDLYDANGFYNGQVQNNFPFAWQTTNAPEYASDVLHGFAADQWLNEDGGKQLPHEMALPTVLSVAQWQRVAKITLLRNRQQGSGTFEMRLASLGMQPTDVMQFTFGNNGWSEKSLEVTGFGFHVAQDSSGAQSLRCNVAVIETEESVYEWDLVNELTVLDVPASPAQTTYDPAPPTNLTLTSGATTAIVNADGTVQPRIGVAWDTPLDTLTKEIQIQYQQVGAAVWLSAPSVDVALNLGYISGVIAGQQYNVRIRSVRANGAFSDWSELDGYTVSITLSVVTDVSLAQSSLIGQAFTDGTAEIIVNPFTAVVGQLSISILPAGPFIVSGLAQSTLYWVYYVDEMFNGGAITPIATTNQSDYLDKVGFFLIGALVTPFTDVTGATRYSPSSFTDVGSRTTQSPGNAFDGNSGTAAIVQATALLRVRGGGLPSQLISTNGNCTWQGFPSVVITSSTVMVNVVASLTFNADGGIGIISAIVGGAVSTMLSTTAAAGQTTYQLALPAGTNLSTVSINVNAGANAVSGGAGNGDCTITIDEIFIL